MYKKFAVIVLLGGPVLAIMADSFTSGAPKPVQPETIAAPLANPQQTSKPAEPIMATSQEDAANATTAIIPTGPGMPMLDPKGIEPAPALTFASPKVSAETTPEVPPGLSPHDRPSGAPPPGIPAEAL